MELREHLELVVLQHGIEKNREIIVRSSKGELCYIPLNQLFDVITNLYAEQQALIVKKLHTVQNSANKVMDLFYQLCLPLANLRL